MTLLAWCLAWLIDFVIGEAADDHFHLPFLIAPGGWSTYRGS